MSSSFQVVHPSALFEREKKNRQSQNGKRDIFRSVQSLSRVWFFATPWTAAHQASLSITNSWSLLELMSIKLVISSNHLTLCYPLLSTFNLSQHRGLFQWVSSSHHVAKILEFSALGSVFSVNIQGWFPLVLTGWISLQSKGLLRVFSSTTIGKPSLGSNSHIGRWLLEKPQLWL